MALAGSKTKFISKLKFRDLLYFFGFYKVADFQKSAKIVTWGDVLVTQSLCEFLAHNDNVHQKQTVTPMARGLLYMAASPLGLVVFNKQVLK